MMMMVMMMMVMMNHYSHETLRLGLDLKGRMAHRYPPRIGDDGG
jgi:hypothetical protein